MDAYFLHVSNKLDNIRNSPQKESLLGLEQLKLLSFWRACAAEFIATLCFVFMGTAAILTSANQDGQTDKTQIALAFGLGIASMIQFIGHVSGGHINPAVSIAMAVTRNISILRAIMYTIAQCLGGICGSAILYGVVGTNAAMGENTLPATMSQGQGFGCEVVLTFILVAVIYGTTDGDRVSFGLVSLAIGLTVTVAHTAGIGLSGASMNPARSLGPSVVSGNFKDHWVYWVGPIVGGILAGLSYKFLFSPYRGIKSFDTAMQEMMLGQKDLPVPSDFQVVHTQGSQNAGYEMSASQK